MVRARMIVALVAAGLLMAGAASAAFAEAPGGGITTTGSTGVPMSGEAQSGEWFSAANSSGPVVTVPGSVPVVAAPRALVTLPVSLDVVRQEQYWFWAYGVEVTVGNLAPGEPVQLSMTSPNGSAHSWGTFSADGTGVLVKRVRYSDVNPEELHAPAGVTQITATTMNGEVGAAAVEIVPNGREVLRVSVSSPTVSQDVWLDQPVMVRAEGLQPLQKVYFNLSSPDLSTVGIGLTEGLHSDKDGVFEYSLRAVTANSSTGEWRISIQGENEDYGSAVLSVTAGAVRHQDKTLVLATSSLTGAEFAQKPGLRYSLSGFAAFDTYELTLVTPRGAETSLGLARTNGVGGASDALTGPDAAPLGSYTLRVRSSTTGGYAERVFSVTGENGQTVQNPSVSVSPTVVSRSSIVSDGVSVQGTGFSPGMRLQLELRDASFKRVALTTGTDAEAVVDSTGSFQYQLQALASPLSGVYRIRIDGGGDGFDYQLFAPVTIGEDAVPASAPPTVQPPAAEPLILTPASEAFASAEVPAPSPTPPTGATPSPASDTESGSELIVPDAPVTVLPPFGQITPEPVTR